MKRLALVPMALGLLLTAQTSPVQAQYPQYPAGGAAAYSPYAIPYLYSRPQVPFPGAGGPRLSPYLNLMNGGNPAVNFYLQVRPEQERRRYQAATSIELRGLQRQLAAPPELPPEEEFAPNPSVTGGYVAVFNNTGGYFATGGYFPGQGGARTMPPVPRRTPAATPAPKR